MTTYEVEYDQYPTHRVGSPSPAAVAVEEFLNKVASDAVSATIAEFDARVTSLRVLANEVEARLTAVSGQTFVPLDEVQNLLVNMDLAQRELADARRALSDAYQAKVTLEDERKTAEAMVATRVEGRNESERKTSLALLLASDGDYRQVANAARQAVFEHEERQAAFDLAEKQHQAQRAVMELYASWLRAMSR